MIEQSVRIAGALTLSSWPVISLVKDEVTMITSSDIGAKYLIPKYTILLKIGSLL